MPDGDQAGGTTPQTILTNISAPRLCGVSISEFVTYKEKRRLYEKQIAEHNLRPGIRVTPLSYRATIDDELLEIFIEANWITGVEKVSELTDAQIETCVATKSQYRASAKDLDRLDTVLSEVKIDTTLAEAEDRIWSMYKLYKTVLRRAGMADLVERKPHICIRHLMHRVVPNELKVKLRRIIAWEKDENFDKKDVPGFVRRLADESRKLQEEHPALFRPAGRRADTSSGDRGGSLETSTRDRTHEKQRKNNKNGKQSSTTPTDGKTCVQRRKRRNNVGNEGEQIFGRP